VPLISLSNKNLFSPPADVDTGEVCDVFEKSSRIISIWVHAIHPEMYHTVIIRDRDYELQNFFTVLKALN
jgi:hypothetical protein